MQRVLLADSGPPAATALATRAATQTRIMADRGLLAGGGVAPAALLNL